MKEGCEVIGTGGTRLAMLFAILGVGAGIGLCLPAQSEHDTPVPTSSLEFQEKPTSSDSLAAEPAEAATPGHRDYIIGPEDVLEIDVFNVPELSRTVRVAHDGTISLALLGHVKATGYTPLQLRRVLEQLWGESYLERPQITVFVREYRASPVSVVGAVERPGVHYLSGPRTLIEILAMAGGLAKKTSAVAGRSVFITRPGGFRDLPQAEGLRIVSGEKIEINLHALLYSDESLLNIVIHPFDIISVSRADVVYVVGEVWKPGGFTLEDRETVTVLRAIAMAEGVKGTAAQKATRIIRTDEEGRHIEIPVNLGKIMQGKEKDITLAANDILFVPTSTGKAAAKRAAEAVVGTISGMIIYNRF
jgi:polysaccharide export outer membrane protein